MVIQAPPPPPPPRPPTGNGRVMGTWFMFPQHQLKRVLTCGQVQRHLGLAGPENGGGFHRRADRLQPFLGTIGAIAHRCPVDQQVMMPGVRRIRSGGRDAHAAQTEMDRSPGW